LNLHANDKCLIEAHQSVVLELVALIASRVAMLCVGLCGARTQMQLQIQQQQDTANESQLRAVATNEMVIADREVGIDGIARSVQELHEIFEDINALVVEQGDHIDNIQTNIEKASNHQALAVTELVAASRHQRRSRKCMCWGIIGVMLAVVIFLVVFEIVIKK